MKTTAITFYLVLFINFFVNAQSSSGKTAIKLVDKISASWKLSKIYDGKKEIPLENQIGAIDNIEFTRDNFYISQTNDNMIDSGTFTTNENDQLIYLASTKKVDLHATDEWQVSAVKNTIILSKREPSALRKFRYVYVKQKAKKLEITN